MIIFAITPPPRPLQLLAPGNAPVQQTTLAPDNRLLIVAARLMTTFQLTRVASLSHPLREDKRLLYLPRGETLGGLCEGV